MTDVTLRAESDMGRNAAQVLENPAFNEAFERMRAQLVEEWSKCPVNEVERQQFILQQMKLVNRIKTALAAMIDQGKLAESRMPIPMDPETSRQSPIVRDFHRVRSRR